MSAMIWIPLVILGVMLTLLASFAILARVQNGRYLRPVAMLLAKVPFIRKAMQRASIGHLERTNPELASAMKKLQTFGEPTSPDQAQRMLRVLTPKEREAYMDAAGEQQLEQQLEAPNRQLRRRMEHGGAGMPMRPANPTPARPGAAGRRKKKKQ